jgi:flavin reductase (DIM6/NTAB) family NADH-FMN oxidoreductase RutF
MGISANPMVICFAPSNRRDGQKKHTLRNIEETGEFVVNLVNEDLAHKMNQTSAEYPYGVSEFEKAELTPVPSLKVLPPRVLESPVNLECQLLQTITFREVPQNGNVVIGKVIYIHIVDSIWNEGKIDHRALKPIGRLEADFYIKTTDTFEMARPQHPSKEAQHRDSGEF